MTRHLFIACLIVSGAVLGAADQPLTVVESALIAADARWQAGAPAEAAAGYQALLAELPEVAAPMRPLLILRLVRAHQAADDRAAALAALTRLEALDYIPEHHAVAAEELRAVLAGEPHPGLRRTPIPPLATNAHRIVIGAQRDAADLPAALTLARRHRAAHPQQAIHILFAPGRYRVAAPVSLTAADAGRPEAPLVIASLDPAQPAEIYGSTLLERWQPLRDEAVRARLPASSRDRVLVCDLRAHGIDDLGPIILGGGHSSMRAQLPDQKIPEGRHCTFLSFPVPELFIAGRPQPLAAWPDRGFTTINPTQAPTNPEELARRLRWRGETDLWLHGYWYWDWSDAWEQVAAVRDDGVIDLVPPVNRYGFRRSQARVVNALSELDQPGEWKLDAAAGRLYLLPPEGFDPATCSLSVATGFLRAEGLDHLHVRGLHLREFRGDILDLKNCSDILLARLELHNASGMGLRYDGGKRLLVHSCTITSMGRNGLDLLSGSWQQLDAGETLIENCRIGNLSRIDRTYTPALMMEGRGITVRHCHFENIPSSAIRIESSASLIELNVFKNCLYESGDQGVIDCWANPLLRGNVIRWNDFQAITASASYGAAAIRYDDWMSGFMAYENLFRTASRRGFGAVQIRWGNYNHIEGNILINGHALVSGRSGRVNQRHARVRWALANADWRSEAWAKAHPLIPRLLDGGNNYLLDNLSLVGPRWGRGVVRFANQTLPQAALDQPQDLRPLLPPWRQIPLEHIGPYAAP